MVNVHSDFMIKSTAYFAIEKIQIVRMDPFIFHHGKGMTTLLDTALQNAHFTLPGQHALLVDLEQWWYPLPLRVLITICQSGANRIHWFNTIRDTLNKEYTLVNDISLIAPTCGYQCTIGVVHNVSDLFYFYAPDKFTLGKADFTSKWMVRDRSGFWFGSDNAIIITASGFFCVCDLL